MVSASDWYDAREGQGVSTRDRCANAPRARCGICGRSWVANDPEGSVAYHKLVKHGVRPEKPLSGYCQWMPGRWNDAGKKADKP